MSQPPPNLVSYYERPLFLVSVVVSVLLWLILTIFTLGIGLGYVLMIGLILLIIHGLMMARVRGYGVKVTAEQFPQLHKINTDCAKRLGMWRPPDMFLLQLDGMLNAFATHFLSRDFVILTSEMLDACEDDPQCLAFVITHELTHLQRQHTRWMYFLGPSRLVPFLGMAYSRACEYTCDAHAAHYGTQNLADAVKAVQVLSTGSKRWADKIDQTAYQQQLQDERGVLSTIAELGATHPFTAKRVAHLRRVIGGEDVPQIKYSFWGTVLAVMFNQQVLALLFLVIIVSSVMATLKDTQGDIIKQLSGQAPLSDSKTCDELSYAYYDAQAYSVEEATAYKAYAQACSDQADFEPFYNDYKTCDPVFSAYLDAPVDSTTGTERLAEYIDCIQNAIFQDQNAETACEDAYEAYTDLDYGTVEEATARATYLQCKEDFIAQQNV